MTDSTTPAPPTPPGMPHPDMHDPTMPTGMHPGMPEEIAAEMAAANANKTRLVDVPLDNQNIALNVLISFISLAQQKGAYNVQESAKIWECIKMFQQAPPATENINMEVTD